MGTDGLTELPLVDELTAALGATPVTAVFVDVDGLIWVNDGMGFLEGDRALRAIGSCVRDLALRHGGVAARIGGDEFLVVLPRATIEEGSAVAAEILASVDAKGLVIDRYEGSRCPFDSVGVSTLVFPMSAPMTADRRQLVDDLGYALWQAKSAAGRKGRVAGVVDVLRPAPAR